MKLPATRPTTQPQELAANWTDRCVVKLDETGSAQQIDLHGKVNINHPQMKLKSDTLSLALEPDPKDKSKATLKTATATGHVDADLSDAANVGRKVTSQKLVVTMDKGPDGSMFARQVDAEGSVNAVDSQQSLQADRVQLVMKPKPATRPAATQPAGDMAAVDLESFLAEGGVVLKGKESAGTADRIAVSTRDGQQLIELTGKPATLTQQGRTLTGPSILARPDDGYALVDGAGSLKTEGSATTRPADMTWANRAELDAAKNLITFIGQIKIKTTDTDGTLINATSDECIVTLRDTPTTKPAADKGEALRNKAVASVALAGKVVVDSELITDGKLIKRNNLRAERVTMGLDDQQQFSSIDIPGAGQMLHEDRRDAKPGEDQPVGALAIQWNKSFRMDQKPEPLATFTGDVKIARLEKPDSPETDVMRLNASRVRISFEQTAATTRPTTRLAAATRPTTRRALVAGVRHVDASAPVVFEHQKTKIIAQSLLFTPSTNLVVLLGNEGQPVQWYNDNASQGTFTELWYDMEKQEPKFKRPTIRARP
jgi:lipopolysaccharide export system protein LptA